MSDPSADSTDSVWQKASACSVCSKQLEPISRPQLLPCCHSACRDCIEDNANQLTEASATNTGEDHLHAMVAYGMTTGTA